MFTQSAVAIAFGGKLLIRIEASEPRHLSALVHLIGTHASRLFAPDWRRNFDRRGFDPVEPFPDPIAL